MCEKLNLVTFEAGKLAFLKSNGSVEQNLAS